MNFNDLLLCLYITSTSQWESTHLDDSRHTKLSTFVCYQLKIYTSIRNIPSASQQMATSKCLTVNVENLNKGLVVPILDMQFTHIYINFTYSICMHKLTRCYLCFRFFIITRDQETFLLVFFNSRVKGVLNHSNCCIGIILQVCQISRSTVCLSQPCISVSW